MTNRKHRTLPLALLALVLVFAGCKAESPTAPTSGSPGVPNPGGGGTTPPSGATITLTASNPSPLVSSTSVITATVTQSGAPVPNGTAVEFSTNLGTFSDSAAQTTLRTTTNGVATATLTAATVGTSTVTAVVNNVSQKIQVTFQTTPVVPVPVTPDTAPKITSVAPITGRPAGGETITINGVNFRSPVRVLFDLGGGVPPKEGLVTSVTPTQITVITPPIDLGSGQQKKVSIIVIVEAGTIQEQKLTQVDSFTFLSEVLTPKITTLSPASGPIEGGTRITVFGEGFQAPVQVFFGSAEAQVLTVNFSQLIVISPTARETNPNASGTVTGPVSIRVININSATTATLAAAFRYTPKMQITAITPTVGSALGGTDVRIDGIGFNDPVTVDIAGVRAQTLRVSSSEILVRTAATASPCAPPVSGAVVVTNVDNGDFASSALAPSPQSFSYLAVLPVITNVAFVPGVTIGGNVTATVLNPGVGPLGSAFVGFTISDKAASVSPNPITAGTGSRNFLLVVPPNLTFPSVACTVGSVTGTQFGPATFPITFTNVTTGCTTTLANAVTVQPPGPNACAVAAAVAVVSAPAGGACAIAPTTTVSPAAPTTTTITIMNGAPAGGTPLTLTGATGSGDFTVSPAAQTVNPGQSRSFTVTFTPTATGVRTGNATFTTNDPTTPTLTVCLQGTATAPPIAAVTTPAGGACANAPPASIAAAASTTTTITIANSAAAGGSPLSITGAAASPADFTISPASQTVPAGQSRSFTVTFAPTGAPGPRNGNASFTTNDPNNASLNVCLTGTATP